MKKLTRRQLRRLIEAALKLEPGEIDAIKAKTSEEGGAMGLDMAADIVNQEKQEDEDDASPDAVGKALEDQTDDLTVHADGDLVNKTGLSERKTKRKKRKSQSKRGKKYSLYPYVYGFGYGRHDDGDFNPGDAVGGDIGGFGDGGGGGE